MVSTRWIADRRLTLGKLSLPNCSTSSAKCFRSAVSSLLALRSNSFSKDAADSDNFQFGCSTSNSGARYFSVSRGIGQKTNAKGLGAINLLLAFRTDFQHGFRLQWLREVPLERADRHLCRYRKCELSRRWKPRGIVAACRSSNCRIMPCRDRPIGWKALSSRWRFDNCSVAYS